MNKRMGVGIKSVLFALALSLPGLAVWAGTPAAKPFSQQDISWLLGAHQVNLAEMKVGKMADEKGASGMIRTIGHTLASDHAKLDRKLQPALNKIGHVPDAPSSQQQSVAKKLSMKHGKTFDQMFLLAEMAGHKSAIEMTKREMRVGRSPEVKKLAKETLAVLVKHLAALRHASSGMQGAY